MSRWYKKSAKESLKCTLVPIKLFLYLERLRSAHSGKLSRLIGRIFFSSYSSLVSQFYTDLRFYVFFLFLGPRYQWHSCRGSPSVGSFREKAFLLGEAELWNCQVPSVVWKMCFFLFFSFECNFRATLKQDFDDKYLFSLGFAPSYFKINQPKILTSIFSLSLLPFKSFVNNFFITIFALI